MDAKKKIKTLKSYSKKTLIKWTPEELEQAQKKADQYADGNLSAWIRYAAINFKPSKKDLK